MNASHRVAISGLAIIVGSVIVAVSWFVAGASYRAIDPGPCGGGVQFSGGSRNYSRAPAPTPMSELCVPAGLVWLGVFLGLSGMGIGIMHLTWEMVQDSRPVPGGALAAVPRDEVRKEAPETCVCLHEWSDHDAEGCTVDICQCKEPAEVRVHDFS